MDPPKSLLHTARRSSVSLQGRHEAAGGGELFDKWLMLQTADLKSDLLCRNQGQGEGMCLL